MGGQQGRRRADGTSLGIRSGHLRDRHGADARGLEALSPRPQRPKQRREQGVGVHGDGILFGSRGLCALTGHP